MLATIARNPTEDASLTLAQALAGSGLEAEEIELLESMMSERRFAKGEVVFRYGDPGDSMYVLLQGQIGIWLPEKHTEDDAPHGRRLISFAPGVVFGDMGLLAGAARSADAIAESDAIVLELKREQYEQLVAEYPQVFGKLLLNISLLLASRVRSLSDELQAAHAVELIFRRMRNGQERRPPHRDALLTQHLQALLGDAAPLALAFLQQHLQWIELTGGEVLMEQGESGDSAYLCISGRLRVYVRGDDGSQRMVREMSRGEVIGEMSLYTGEPRSATVIALRNSVLVKLDKQHFDELLTLSPQAVDHIYTADHSAPADRTSTATGGGARHDWPAADYGGIALEDFAQRLAQQLKRFGRVLCN